MTRTKDGPHNRSTVQQKLDRDSVVQLDFGFIRSEARPKDDEEDNEDVEGEGDAGGRYGITLLICDQDTGMRLSVPLESKAVTKYAVDAAASALC